MGNNLPEGNWHISLKYICQETRNNSYPSLHLMHLLQHWVECIYLSELLIHHPPGQMVFTRGHVQFGMTGRQVMFPKGKKIFFFSPLIFQTSIQGSLGTTTAFELEELKISMSRHWPRISICFSKSREAMLTAFLMHIFS